MPEIVEIVVIGSLNMDLVATAPRIPVVGETILGDNYFAQPGGKGANQAYAAARLGGNTAMIGCVGNDDFGRHMRNNLAAAGCDISQIHVEHAASGVALIFVSANGHNCIVVVPGANSRMRPAHVLQGKSFLSQAKVVLLQLETPLDTVISAAQTAHEFGATVILDPAPAPSGKLPPEVLCCVDILTPNETEAASLSGHALARLDPSQAAEAGLALRNHGVDTVLMKLGDQGCMIISGEDPVLLPAPRVTAVDTTAAGDVFNGAFAVAHTDAGGDSWLRIANLGCARAAP